MRRSLTARLVLAGLMSLGAVGVASTPANADVVRCYFDDDPEPGHQYWRMMCGVEDVGSVQVADCDKDLSEWACTGWRSWWEERCKDLDVPVVFECRLEQ